MLREVFGIEADIVTDPRSGVPLCLPYELYRAAAEGKGQRSKQNKKNDERDIADKVASIL
ncbi:hypothetical protein D3C77_777240 [compost metagenome]